MIVEKNISLKKYNTFGIEAKALQLVRIKSEANLQAILADPELASLPKFILGGGSNIVITADVKPLVLKVEMMGKRLVSEDAKAWIVEAQAGEDWHEFVKWTLENGWPGLENMAMIPGTVGASPVQNIGAYGVEFQDRFESLDAVNLQTGELMQMQAIHCGFGYRDSVFKHGPGQIVGASSAMGLAGRALITKVRFRLPKAWRAETSYTDIQKRVTELGTPHPTALQIFEMVCAIRKAKLPQPEVIGNVGSFFKNPTVTADQCADIIAREPKLVHYQLSNGEYKLAAAWLIDACGWRGKTVGHAGVYEKQALILVNKGGASRPCTGGEVVTLAQAIQTSVYERFGIRLEIEPVVV
jgi:UDP-N-acetylmuramate dehydrogenase